MGRPFERWSFLPTQHWDAMRGISLARYEKKPPSRRKAVVNVVLLDGPGYLRTFARSVFSQVNSFSVRPKCP